MMGSERRSPSAGSGRSAHSRASSMGYDGGEAGRRMAAEDEYIRRELAETTAFCNAFWGVGDGGFEAIMSRIRGANRTLDELRYIYKERADIEADYARRLAKLAKTSLGRDETGGMRQALETLKTELEVTARSHSELANAMKKELEGAVADFQARVSNARKNSIASIEKLHRHKQTQETYVNKSRERYEQDCIKINGYTAQSSLVQGRDLDKVTSKLDKAQSTVSTNEKDYQNFVRALKDTTLKWNAEWKAFLDQTQDAEEDRLDFMKSNMWNYANAVSAICVTDDESCERVRVSLENTETLRDVQHFIQSRGTGAHIAEPPEYINYARGQAPPPRPAYRLATFQRNSTRPAPGPLPPAQPAQQYQAPAQQQVPPPVQQQQQQQQQQPQPPQASGYAPPPGAVALPGMTAPVPQATASVPAPHGSEAYAQQPVVAQSVPPSTSRDGAAAAPLNGALGTVDSSSDPRLDRRLSAKNMAGASGTQASGSSAPQVAAAGVAAGAVAGAAAAAEEDPIAKALASLRMRQKSPAPGSIRGRPAGGDDRAAAVPPPLSKSPGPGGRPGASPQLQQPGVGAYGVPQQHYAQPGEVQGRPRSPSAAFMQAPERASSPMPVEQVVGQYGQAFPGERKTLSRQNSTASRASQNVAGSSRAPERARSPAPAEGFAGVGARGRSPSPAPFQSAGSQAAQRQSVPPQSQPARPSTPLGISLDASGSVTHDQLAEQYRKQQAAQQAQAPPPAAPLQHQSQPSFGGQSYHQQAPPQQTWAGQPQAQQQAPYARPVSPGPAHHQQASSYAQPAGSIGRAGYAPPAATTSYAPPVQQQPPAAAAAFSPYGQAPPAQQPVAANGYGQPAGSETPAAAYMHEYQRAHNMSHQQQQQQQQQAWQQAPPQQQPVQVQPQAAAPQPSYSQHPPTGQYSDSGKPILFYVKALYDYTATTAEEFSFTAGDIIAVTHTEADGWWQGELLDEARRRPHANTFPSNFVVLLM